MLAEMYLRNTLENQWGHKTLIKFIKYFGILVAGKEVIVIKNVYTQRILRSFWKQSSVCVSLSEVEVDYCWINYYEGEWPPVARFTNPVWWKLSVGYKYLSWRTDIYTEFILRAWLPWRFKGSIRIELESPVSRSLGISYPWTGFQTTLATDKRIYRPRMRCFHDREWMYICFPVLQKLFMSLSSPHAYLFVFTLCCQV